MFRLPRMIHHATVSRRRTKKILGTSGFAALAEAARPLYAVLVDANNANATHLAAILEEIARLGGDASVRKIYGDFSKPQLSPWKNMSLELSFRQVNAFSYVPGKGSSDAALIIDAMKLLFCNPSIAGFAIVSSDSDFSPLAQQLRESGKHVLGFGNRQTPQPFVTACERFIHVENLETVYAATDPKLQENQATTATAPHTLTKAMLAKVIKTVEEIAGHDGWAGASVVGDHLRILKSDFDPRDYGHKQLGALLTAVECLDLKFGEGKSKTTLYVRVKRGR